MPSDFLEKTLEDIVFENKSIIHTKGFPKFKKNVFRQVAMPSGRKIDIFSYEIKDGKLYADIFELKLDRINTDAVCQAYNYFSELFQVIEGGFRSFDIHIVLIGRKYDTIDIFNKMNLSYSCYTYDYTMDGIMFTCHRERNEKFKPEESFINGLWAFNDFLSFSHGQPSVMNFSHHYDRYVECHPEFEENILKVRERYISMPKNVEVEKIVYLPQPTIETVHFPEKLAWTPEFSAKIPPPNYFMEDLEEDYSDFEPEPTEDDLSSFDPEADKYDYF